MDDLSSSSFGWWCSNCHVACCHWVHFDLSAENICRIYGSRTILANADQSIFRRLQLKRGRCIATRDLYQQSTMEPKYEPELIMSWESWVKRRQPFFSFKPCNLAAEIALLLILSGNSEQRVEKEASLGNDVHTHCTFLLGDYLVVADFLQHGCTFDLLPIMLASVRVITIKRCIHTIVIQIGLAMTMIKLWHLRDNKRRRNGRHLP